MKKTHQNIKKTTLQEIEVSKIVTLKRNPQFLTPKQMESLKTSIKRDGFCVPILVRPIKGEKFEVVSGNHRLMAAIENKMTSVHCVVVNMDDSDAKRLAVNLNTIHGEPNPEILAPFLADMNDETLSQIHLEDVLLDELLKFDEHLKQRLDELQPPDAANHDSPTKSNSTCICPKCKKVHLKGN